MDSDMHPLALVARPVFAMGDVENIDDRRQSARRESDRSVWSNPQLWVSICTVLLTLAITILGFIASQLSQMNARLQATSDTMLTSTTRQSAEISSLAARIDKLENAMDTQTKAYNFNLSTRLAVVEAKTGVKPKNPNSQGDD